MDKLISNLRHLPIIVKVIGGCYCRMPKFIFPNLLLVLTSIGIANAQSSNFRAQGNYYSARTNYQAGKYSEALDYIKKCKTALGGTNRQAQYIHVLSAYNLRSYEEALTELQTYFDLEEKKLQSVTFDKSVEELTSDETKALTKLIDPIYESVELRKTRPCNQCHGVGRVTKMERKHCQSCGSDDKFYHLKEAYRDGANYSGAKGKMYTEKKGSTKTVCTDCNGKGKTICGYCDGEGYRGPFYSECSNCTKTTGWKGYSFYCKGKCGGGAYVFTTCTICKGEKYYEVASNSTENCGRCSGHGFLK